MKTPKIVNSMQHIDEELISAANEQNLTAKRPSWVKWAAIAAAFVLMFSGVFAAANAMSQNRVDAVVAFDVNPSMELEINKDEKVVNVVALNAEAEVVLADMDLEKVDVNVAVNAIIGSMLKNGYLSVNQNSILISVNSKDKTKAAELQQTISADIEQILRTSHIEASVIAQTFEKDAETEQKAEENHISAAKATLINKIIEAGLTDANGNAYTYETLANMKVNELKMLLESKEVEVSGIQSSGTAQNDSYIGKEKALSIAFIHAGLAKDESDASAFAVVRHMHVELDFDDGRMLYSVEFDTAEFEYEYEIDAQSGEIVEVEKETPDDHDDHDDHSDKKDNQTENTENKENSDNDIGREKALSIAFIHAGLAKDESDASAFAVVLHMQVEPEFDDGRTLYSVEFDTAEFEYEYEIDAKTGEILDFEKEPNDHS